MLVWVATSPIALVVGGVIGLVTVFSWMASTVADSTTSLSAVWAGMQEDFAKSFGAIIQSLQSGNLSGAMDVAWALLKVEWARGIGWLEEKWIAFKDGFQNIWTEAVYGTASIATSAWALISSGWTTGIASLREAWATYLHWFADAWAGASQGVSKAWLWLESKFGVIDENTRKGGNNRASRSRLTVERKMMRHGRHGLSGRKSCKNCKWNRKKTTGFFGIGRKKDRCSGVGNYDGRTAENGTSPSIDNQKMVR
jgi:hypothetical protein